MKRFKLMHILDVHQGRGSDGLRACNTYELTLYDADLHMLMTEICESERREIEAERELRKEQRNRWAAVRARATELARNTLKDEPADNVPWRVPEGDEVRASA